MPLPQDIRPAFQDIQDTLVRAEAPWIEQSPMSKVKVLWVGRETGTWASLHHWKKGYVAPRHKHLAGAHAYVLTGKLQVRDGVLNAGDYVYEPSGVLHDETTALEDTTYLFICNGAVLFFDENGFTRYTNWEVMEKLRAQAEVAAGRSRGIANASPVWPSSPGTRSCASGAPNCSPRRRSLARCRATSGRAAGSAFRARPRIRLRAPRHGSGRRFPHRTRIS